MPSRSQKDAAMRKAAEVSCNYVAGFLLESDMRPAEIGICLIQSSFMAIAKSCDLTATNRTEAMFEMRRWFDSRFPMAIMDITGSDIERRDLKNQAKGLLDDFVDDFNERNGG